jgi:hypothetical protein
MTEGLSVDGDAVEVAEQAFAAAMAAPEPDEAVAEPPAAKDPDAPFGRDASGAPKAPYGYKDDGSIKRSAGGRKPKRERTDRHDRPRVGPASGGTKATPAAKTQAEYREGLEQLLGGVWAISAPFLPADAGAILTATPALSEAWSRVAAQDPRVGRVVTMLTDGSLYGAAITSTLMLGLQLAANHGMIKPEAVSGFGVKSREELEAVNAATLMQLQEAHAQAA